MNKTHGRAENEHTEDKSNLLEPQCYGIFINIRSEVIKHFIENTDIKAKNKTEVGIDFDGEVERFTLAEFKERIFSSLEIFKSVPLKKCNICKQDPVLESVVFGNVGFGSTRYWLALCKICGMGSTSLVSEEHVKVMWNEKWGEVGSPV